ncbi:N-alpha-acetyltransferase 30 [Marasmius crinis-equi]|uniref:N-alpha-acetyltransferase 30 n=1 Tax=Marasmius crinis-equi TaxID=585013 RepID=A0ABR3FPJ7_9AGAR
MLSKTWYRFVQISKLFALLTRASTLVRSSMEAMKEDGVEEIVLETEYDNYAALSLYESLGFIREKRLFRFYLNGKDAFRLVLPIPPQTPESEYGSDDTISSTEESQQLSRVRRKPARQVYRAIRVSPYTDEEDEGVSGR